MTPEPAKTHESSALRDFDFHEPGLVPAVLVDIMGWRMTYGHTSGVAVISCAAVFCPLGAGDGV